jgi:amphi-Trp domain-containing protein
MTARANDRVLGADPQEAGMDLFETDEKQRLRREAAAARLHEIADAIASHNAIDLERDGRRVTVHVPDEVDFKLEVEIGDGEGELEIELTW